MWLPSDAGGVIFTVPLAEDRLTLATASLAVPLAGYKAMQEPSGAL